MTKTYREKLLTAIKELNIELPKGKYIKNDDLKNVLIKYLASNGKNVSTKPETQPETINISKGKVNIKKCILYLTTWISFLLKNSEEIIYKTKVVT